VTPNEVSSETTVGFVIPLYNEEAVLEIFYEALTKELSTRDELLAEFIFINDGSKDETLAILRKLRAADSRVTIIDLSSNRGQQIALTAGLDYSNEMKHDVTVLMDADMQDPPEIALKLIERILAGADMVYAQRATSNGRTVTKKATSDLFYYTLGKLSAVEMPARTSDFRAANAKVVAEVVKYKEHSRFLRGIFSHVGFKQEAYLFERPERAAGVSKYSYGKLLKLAFDALMGYSTFPLRAISTIGVTVSVLTVLFGLGLVIAKIVNPDFAVYGWASTTLIIAFFAGLQLLTLGVMGSYIGRIYIQVLERPLYSVSSIERG